MEVFLRQIPSDLTDNGLEKHLTPIIKALGIRDWSCQKIRKKTFGKLTFLRAQDGKQFLEKHPTTTILGSRVRCTLSRNPPDTILLKCLHKTAEDRQRAGHTTSRPTDENIVFNMESLSCGHYDYTDKELVYCPDIEWLFSPGVVKFVKNAVIMRFKIGNSNYKVEIPYRIVESLVVTSQPSSLTFTLWEPPRFFENPRSDLDNIITNALASLSLGPKPTPINNRLVELQNASGSHTKVVGQALVYRVNVSREEFFELSGLLIKRDMLAVIRHNLRILPYYLRMSLQHGMYLLNKTIHEVVERTPFPVLFQIEALARNGILLPWTARLILLKALEHDEEPNNTNTRKKTFPISGEAVRNLISQTPFPSIDTDSSLFGIDEIWELLQENEKRIRKGYYQGLITERGRQNLTLVHKVDITPTGMRLNGPDPEAKNRILRRFPEHTEYFIRVQFCDEDGTDLRFNSHVSNSAIYDRFRKIMIGGLEIAGRIYGFLGFSHSSLRSHSAWFMAPFVCDGALRTYFSVIKTLGNFGDIRSPARCAARIGQAFSETPYAISLRDSGLQHGKLSDIESRDGNHVFSDGVGTLSPAAVEAIRNTIPRTKGNATCFQIRWGGAKGMLGLDARLEGSLMNVRGSMVKFHSEDIDNLEICDIANKPKPLVLNRQMIRILEDMGLPASWFTEQQSKALRRLQLVTAHISNVEGFLQKQMIAEHVGFPQLIRRLDSIGMSYKRDFFMRSIVEAAILSELRLLKHKARIPIEQGVTLFGIMDETGYLPEGEVFITFDETTFIGGHHTELDGRMMLITRSPALHPGDIQMATNTIPPIAHPLRALRNCIVFSQNGFRDLPSCLSGGDLDGDTYSIIWDKAAVAGCQRIFQPAEYPRKDPVDIGKTVEKEDMTDFFINFMATDQLGLIATRHMILADQKSAGTDDPDCKLLAELHSTGVDYSKTGIPVDMKVFRDIKTNPYRPHFLAPSSPMHIKNKTDITFRDEMADSKLENEDEDDYSGPKYRYYRSTSINGILFDAIDEKKIWYQNVKDMSPVDDRVWSDYLTHIIRECNKKLGGIIWEHMRDYAFNIRHAYEDAIYNATLDYSDHATKSITELEVFTGSIFNPSGVQTRRQRDRSVRLKDECDRILQWTAEMIRHRPASLQGEGEADPDSTQDADIGLQLSIACLDVSQWAGSHRRGVRLAIDEFQSFKIVAACCVARELDAAIRRRFDE